MKVEQFIYEVELIVHVLIQIKCVTGLYCIIYYTACIVYLYLFALTWVNFCFLIELSWIGMVFHCSLYQIKLLTL